MDPQNGRAAARGGHSGGQRGGQPVVGCRRAGDESQGRLAGYADDDSDAQARQQRQMVQKSGYLI